MKHPVKQRPNTDLILAYLLGMFQRLGRTPSRSEFISVTGIAEHQITRFFPSWNDAVRAAGLEPYSVNARLEDRQLLEAWGNAVRKLGRVPPRRLYSHVGKLDHRTFDRRLGPWSALPELFRKFAADKPEWADVVALLPAPKPQPASMPAPRPSSNLAPDLVPNSAPTPARSDIRAPAHPPLSVRPNRVMPPPLQDRPALGRPIDFRGLRHEPVNEQGVVLLFGMIAGELGYIVESIQSGFPDCEAKRQIGPDRWQRVQIEFEFESRNFRDHGHPIAGCDVIVCWRHNWPGCPAHLEILELSSLLKSLPSSA